MIISLILRREQLSGRPLNCSLLKIIIVFEIECCCGSITCSETFAKGSWDQYQSAITRLNFSYLLGATTVRPPQPKAILKFCGYFVAESFQGHNIPNDC